MVSRQVEKAGANGRIDQAKHGLNMSNPRCAQHIPSSEPRQVGRLPTIRTSSHWCLLTVSDPVHGICCCEGLCLQLDSLPWRTVSGNYLVHVMVAADQARNDNSV